MRVGSSYKISLVLLDQEIITDVHDDTFRCIVTGATSREIGVRLLNNITERILDFNIPENIAFEIHGTRSICVTIYKTVLCDHKTYSISVELSGDLAYLEIPLDTFRRVQDNSNFFRIDG